MDEGGLHDDAKTGRCRGRAERLLVRHRRLRWSVPAQHGGTVRPAQELLDGHGIDVDSKKTSWVCGLQQHDLRR